MTTAGGDAPANLKERLKASYDAIAPAYNTWTAQHASLRLQYLDKLLQKLAVHDGRARLSVLELGCGSGTPVVEALLGQPNVSVTANDLSSTQISLGMEKFGTDRVRWVEDDMMGLDLAPQSFDAVVALYSIIHLPRSEQGEILLRISNWLKPGGYLLANFSPAESKGTIMEKWLGEKGWMFWSSLGADATMNKMREASLDVVLEETVKADDVDASFLWVMARKGGA